MKGHHSSKTISFLMELIFVLFFFTIASTISVYVIVEAKEKQEESIHLRNALYFGNNLIANQEDKSIKNYLKSDTFYMDEKGNPTIQKSLYKVSIKRKVVEGLTNREECVMHIFDDDELTQLSFLLKKGEE